MYVCDFFFLILEAGSEKSEDQPVSSPSNETLNPHAPELMMQSALVGNL